MAWSIEATDEFQEWFAELNSAERILVAAKIELLEVKGPSLGCPHADTNLSRLKELRIQHAGDPRRVIPEMLPADRLTPEEREITTPGPLQNNKTNTYSSRIILKKSTSNCGDHAAQFLVTAVVRSYQSKKCGIKGSMNEDSDDGSTHNPNRR